MSADDRSNEKLDGLIQQALECACDLGDLDTADHLLTALEQRAGRRGGGEMRPSLSSAYRHLAALKGAS
ncbi:hypothetical protein [Indioceanicola profundi]|uniref:hypothetical protein n=1 Tax=Indioceanicola profundi TaxID=2220096 RepID=UPI0013C3F045|nr:hypothetical protein [Indioceanicola profundi]